MQNARSIGIKVAHSLDRSYLQRHLLVLVVQVVIVSLLPATTF